MLSHCLSFKTFFALFFAILLCNCSNDASNSGQDSQDALQDSNVSVLEDTLKHQDPELIRLPEWPLLAKQMSGKRMPFNEAPKDPFLVKFRNQLYTAILQKDVDFLLQSIHDEIKFSFGMENGKADFIKTWKLDEQAETSRIWPELEKVLKLGGGFWENSTTQFYAPYIFMLDDIDDPYQEAVVIGENVRLRQEPSSSGKILGSLSWDLVTIQIISQITAEEINGEYHPWENVITKEGQNGYVYGKYLRLPIDYRAGFRKADGKWVMDLFIAGD